MKQHNIKPNQKKALFLAKRQLAELVCDAVNLEGINYTLPEVQTLLDGVTIGGHKLSDQIITLNQAKAWHFLFNALSDNTFSLDKNFALKLHEIAAANEALKWGEFRSGNVTIAGTSYMPPAPELLPALWDGMLITAVSIDDIYHQAIFIFLTMAKTQFFYDTNKRMGRFLMNGILLQHGYPVINLPAARQKEFNELMIQFYDDKNSITDKMTNFMLSCLDPRIIAIMNE